MLFSFKSIKSFSHVLKKGLTLTGIASTTPYTYSFVYAAILNTIFYAFISPSIPLTWYVTFKLQVYSYEVIFWLHFDQLLKCLIGKSKVKFSSKFPLFLGVIVVQSLNVADNSIQSSEKQFVLSEGQKAARELRVTSTFSN